MITRRGFPCCVRFPCVHAAATTPVQQMGVLLAQDHPAVSAFPERGIGSACTSSFSRIAQRSLTLRPAHSRGHLFVTRYPKASDISSPPCLLRLLPAGAISPGGPCTHWKAPPCHGAPPLRTFRASAPGLRRFVGGLKLTVVCWTRS